MTIDKREVIGNSKVDKPKRKFNTLRNPWFFYRFPSIVTWLWVVIKLLVMYRSYEPLFNENYLLLYPLTTYSIVIVNKKWSGLITYFLYIFVLSPIGIISSVLFFFGKTFLFPPTKYILLKLLKRFDPDFIVPNSIPEIVNLFIKAVFYPDSLPKTLKFIWQGLKDPNSRHGKYLEFVKNVFLFVVGLSIISLQFIKDKVFIPIIEAIKSINFPLALMGTFVIGILLPLVFDNPKTVGWLAIISHTSLYIFFIFVLKWVTNPFEPIIDFFEFIGDVVIYAIAESGRNNPFLLFFIGPIHKWLLEQTEKLLKPTGKEGIKSRLATFFYEYLFNIVVFVFGITYVLIAFSFSVALMHIEKAFGTIINFQNGGNFSDYFYFSIMSQSISVPDGAEPTNLMGQIWLIWLVLTGIVYITIVLAMFTTKYYQLADLASSKIENRLTEKLNLIKSLIPDWNNKNKNNNSDETGQQVIDLNEK